MSKFNKKHISFALSILISLAMFLGVVSPILAKDAIPTGKEPAQTGESIEEPTSVNTDISVPSEPGNNTENVQDITEKDKAEEKEEENADKDVDVKEITEVITPKTITGAPAIPSDAYNLSIANVATGFTIEASIPAKYTKSPYYYVFGKLFVDGVEVKDYTGATSIAKQAIDISKFGTGYHTAFLQLYNKNTRELQRLIFKEYVAYNGITSQPTYNGIFNVYHNYFNYYPYNMYMANQSGALYMEYKPTTASSWARTGKMTANAIKLYIEQGFAISGLKSNTKYNTRIRYGAYANYKKLTPADFGMTLEQFQKIFGTTKTCIGDGGSYFFGGPVLNTTTIKTGKAKKPAIKSVKVKAVKIKYHKHRVRGHYETTAMGSLIWIRPYTERYYTCKHKVTIKLKKKPGTAGIWVNGKFLKGNKKKYTATFTPYPNYYTKRPPKGQKFRVKIRSYQSKSYYGFSPTYSKKKKVKRK